jgi:hypothetical protein
VEPDAGDHRRGYLSLTQVNKVHHVHTIARVAAMLGEDEDWLRDPPRPIPNPAPRACANGS